MITTDGWKHVELLLSGATMMGLAGHAVNTFPTPKNVYGQWLLGVIKFAVGQRISAMNAFQGHDTVVVAVPQGMGTATTGTATKSQAMKTDITPEAITTETEQTVKTSTTVPNPNPPETPKP
jgi:hypothetical protein